MRIIVYSLLVLFFLSSKAAGEQAGTTFNVVFGSERSVFTSETIEGSPTFKICAQLFGLAENPDELTQKAKVLVHSKSEPSYGNNYPGNLTDTILMSDCLFVRGAAITVELAEAVDPSMQVYVNVYVVN